MNQMFLLMSIVYNLTLSIMNYQVGWYEVYEHNNLQKKQNYRGLVCRTPMNMGLPEGGHNEPNPHSLVCQSDEPNGSRRGK